MNPNTVIKDKTRKKAKKDQPVITPKTKIDPLSRPMFSSISASVNAKMGEEAYHSEEYYQNHSGRTEYVPPVAQMPDTLNGLMIDAMVNDISILKDRPNTNWDVKE